MSLSDLPMAIGMGQRSDFESTSFATDTQRILLRAMDRKSSKQEQIVKDRKNLVRLYLPPPHPGQRLVRLTKRRFNVLACGRRWGKTLFASLEIAGYEAAYRQQRWGWFAPTYKVLDDAFKQTKYRLQKCVERASES